jgi:hypothetical protein
MTTPITIATSALAASPATDPSADAGQWIPGALLALGVLIVVAALLRRWFRRRNAEPETPRQRIDRITATRERDSLESLMVEVQELTRTCAAQIENRALKLETMLELADRRIAELEDAAAATRPRTEPGPKLATPPPEKPRKQTTPDDADPVLRRVLDLAANGEQPAAIARSTGIPIGKVQLMIRLHQRASA